MRLFNKFLVRRRDGTVPEWPYFVLAAADPAASAALRQYAMTARYHRMDPEYCSQVHTLAAVFDAWRKEHRTGDPDAPAHRTDDPLVVAEIPPHATELPPAWQGRATYLDEGQPRP